MIYIMMGGLRNSLFSDIFQAVLHFALLFIIVGYCFNDMPGGPAAVFTFNASWTLKGGLDIFCTGIIQGLFSYPFFDPILMDRLFFN